MPDDGVAGSGDFVLKPWELRGEAREFERIGRDLAKAVGALERDLAALGAPWGTDRPGSGFATVYGPARGELAGGLRGLAGRLGQVGAGLHTMADRTADTDTSAAAGFGPPGAAATPGSAAVVPKDVSA
ncbi:WXG100 family type VII secretion target [Kitasatospora sp. NPDC101176]|uniref:WXG100 family type VII secretion target n=1 Tax=Kitasatospora sp. NPDC101176 TaxID=3364099 RepID=UPI00381C7B14